MLDLRFYADFGEYNNSTVISTTTTTTTTTKNVQIIMLPSHSCRGTLQSFYLKLLYSSAHTFADGLKVSRMTDEKCETWSPFGLSKVTAGPSLWWQTVQRPRCSMHRKGTVAKGSPTSRWHLQRRGVSTAETSTSDDL